MTDKPKGGSQGSDDFHTAKLSTDGNTDNYWGPKGTSDHGHIVVTPDGDTPYIRDVDGTVIRDDSKK